MSDQAGCVLISHGTVESLDDLPRFLENIRRGHAAPPELVAEMRRRYEAIGGRSPLNDIGRALAAKLEARLGLPVRMAGRLFHPYPADVLRELASSGVTRVVSIPLAQHSAEVYAAAVLEAARRIPAIRAVVAAKNWGRTPELTHAFASAIVAALAEVPQGEESRTALVLTAHSLPQSVIDAGDPYEAEVRASADDVVARVHAMRRGSVATHAVAFQSQGAGTARWLEPDLKSVLREMRDRGMRHVVLAPIGFLADHVEILYDLDIEARAWAAELSIAVYRSASLNADDALVDALVVVARDLLGGRPSAEGGQRRRGG